MTFKKAFGLLLILILLAAGGVYLLMVERADDDRMQNLYAEVEPLEREREALIEEKNNLDTEYATKTRDYGTVEVLFEHLNSQIISDVWPVMRSRGVVGVLPISQAETPGLYNKLSWDEVRTLLGDGWGLYLLYDTPTSDIGEWVKNQKKSCELNQVTPPTAIYFAKGNYDPSMDEALINAGIRIVVEKASDGRSSTVTDIQSPLWHTGAMSFGYTGSLTDLELLGRTDGANLALTMDLEIVMNSQKKKYVVAEEQLKSIAETLDSWKDMLYDDDPLEEFDQVGPTPNIYLDTNDADVLHDMYLESLTPEQRLLLPLFRSLNFENALNSHLEMAHKKETQALLRRGREGALDRRISALDEQIAEVYARYDTTKKEIELSELLKK